MRCPYLTAAALCLLPLSSQRVAAQTDLSLPGSTPPIQVRFEMTMGGRTPEAATRAFLDRWFAYFDRDKSGTLDPSESAHIFPFPLADRPAAVMDFKRLDADSDGKGTRAELGEFYRKAGFTPIVVLVDPPAIKSLQLNEALFRHLDRDRNGVLTPAEISNTYLLLRSLDEDEDERLTMAEIVSTWPATATPASQQPAVQAVEPAGISPDVIVRVQFTQATPTPIVNVIAGKTLAVVHGSDGSLLLRSENTVCKIDADADRSLSSFRQARGFYSAQFTTAFGKHGSATKQRLAQTPGMQAFERMFDPANRNGGPELSLTELNGFFDLVEQGIVCQIVVRTSDQGHNLFAFLDQNDDERLETRELFAAEKRLGENASRKALAPDDIPHQFKVHVQRGTARSSFGPVPLPVPAKVLQAPPHVAVKSGPRWFRLMDRNGDGLVSSQEFLGSPDACRRLDKNRDGVIDAAEANSAAKE